MGELGLFICATSWHAHSCLLGSANVNPLEIESQESLCHANYAGLRKTVAAGSTTVLLTPPMPPGTLVAFGNQPPVVPGAGVFTV